MAASEPRLLIIDTDPGVGEHHREQAERQEGARLVGFPSQQGVCALGLA